MFRNIILAMLLVGAVVIAPAAAPDDMTTVAILRFGSLSSVEITEGGILDILESYGYITADDNRILEERQDHETEAIRIIWGDAGFDLPTANLIISATLDYDVDVLVTISTPMTQIAVNATLDTDEPIPVLFTSVTEPYQAGIADAPCIKPDHVTGSRTATSYSYVFSALQMQQPDIGMVGTIFDTGDASGAYGAERIVELSQEFGIGVKAAGVTALADLRAATESLADAGVEAIILPHDAVTTSGLPIIVAIANEAGVPVFHPSFSAIFYGATIGAGASPFYVQGINVGRMLVAHLNGEIEIATTGINTAGEFAIGVNLDSASAQGVEIRDEVMQEAVAVIQGGTPTKLSPAVRAAIARRGVIVPLEERLEDDKAWLESLQCTPEMIAEQQAALDAAGE